MRPEVTSKGQIGQRLRSGAYRYPLSILAMAMLLYSIGPVLVQASDATGPVFSFWRLLFGVPVFALAAAGSRWSRVRNGRRPNPHGWRFWRWIALGGLTFGTHQLLFFSAVKATTVTDVMLIGTLQPIAAAVGALWLFGERPGLPFRAWTSVAMIGAGVVVLSGSAGPEGEPFGMAMALLNVGFYAAFFLIVKRCNTEIDIMSFLLGTLTVAALAVSVFVLAIGDPITAVTGRDLALAAALATTSGFLGHVLSTWAVRLIPANVPPLLKLSQPFLAGGLAWLILGEAATLAHLVGGLITIAGVCGAVLSPSGRAFTQGRSP